MRPSFRNRQPWTAPNEAQFNGASARELPDGLITSSPNTSTDARNTLKRNLFAALAALPVTVVTKKACRLA
jgi:hypothetical protein